jgi:hypothetical protein
MKLAQLRELPLPPTTVAETAWDRAGRRRRRRAAAGVVVSALLVATAAVGVDAVRGDGQSPVPAPAPTPAPSPLPTQKEPLVTDLPDYRALADSVPTTSPHDVTELSEDPVDRAVAAVVPTYGGPESQTTVDVLGDDGRWRHVDVPGLEPTRDQGGYTGNVLVPTGLSTDGTRLALPQPERVVVVDLTTGEFLSFDVPGLNSAVVWQDTEHLLVTEEGRGDGQILDLGDGSVTGSSLTASTGFARDGSWVTWGRSRTLLSSDGTRVLADVANYGGLQLTSPLVDGEVAVGLGGLDLSEGTTTYVGVAGVPVVDRHTGDLRSFLYTEGPDTGFVSTYLLALDGDIVTLAVGFAPDYSDLLVVRWSWLTGELTPVTRMPVAVVSGPVGVAAS